MQVRRYGFGRAALVLRGSGDERRDAGIGKRNWSSY